MSVCLPHVQRSWIGKAHLVSEVIEPRYYTPGTLHEDNGKTEPRSKTGDEWVLINGSPASCVQIGLYHFFQNKGPIDLILSGPNYGRNTTAVFSLSSGTLGGALEGSACGRKSIALSYAFFSRIHDHSAIKEASVLSVKIVEHLMKNWSDGVDLYSINVPLQAGVSQKKILYTNILQNQWTQASCFKRVPSQMKSWDPEQAEEKVRLGELQHAYHAGTMVESGQPAESEREGPAHQHHHFAWAPNFDEVWRTVEKSEPGNDGWAIREGCTR